MSYGPRSITPFITQTLFISVRLAEQDQFQGEPALLANDLLTEIQTTLDNVGTTLFPILILTESPRLDRRFGHRSPCQVDSYRTRVHSGAARLQVPQSERRLAL